MLKIILPPALILFCLIGQSAAQTNNAKKLSVGLSAPGDLLITKADGRRIGHDTAAQKNINEIDGAEIGRSTSGEPLYRIPVKADEQKLTIRITGKTVGTKGNLSITGDGFVVRLLELRLEPDKVLTVTFQPDGPGLVFSSNRAEARLKFNFAVDPPDAKRPSYLFRIERAELAAAKKITLNTDIARAVFDFSDDSPSGSYALDLTRTDPDGTENRFLQKEIGSRKANKYRLEFTNWNAICLRADEQRKGFAKIKCRPLKSAH